MSGVSTHVLDLTRGLPAAGVPVRLERDGAGQVGAASTDDDGRVASLLPDGAAMVAGTYRLEFDTAAYLGEDAFYPSVTVTFAVRDPGAHHHVPLLLSRFGYSTYRGS